MIAFGSHEDTNACGVEKLCKWSELPKYVKNGKFTIETTVIVDRYSIEGLVIPEFMQFLAEQPGFSDRILIIKDTRIHVSSGVRRVLLI